MARFTAPTSPPRKGLLSLTIAIKIAFLKKKSDRNEINCYLHHEKSLRKLFIGSKCRSYRKRAV